MSNNRHGISLQIKKDLRQAEIHSPLEAEIATEYSFCAIFSDVACICVCKWKVRSGSQLYSSSHAYFIQVLLTSLPKC